MKTYILGSKPNASINLVESGDRVVFVNGSIMLMNKLDKKIESHHVISDYILFCETDLSTKTRTMLLGKKVNKVIVTASKKFQTNIIDVRKKLKDLNYSYNVIEYIDIKRKKSILVQSLGFYNVLLYTMKLSFIDLIKELLYVVFCGSFRRVKPSTGIFSALIYNETSGVRCIGIGLENSGYFYSTKNNHLRGHLEIDKFIYSITNIKLIDL